MCLEARSKCSRMECDPEALSQRPVQCRFRADIERSDFRIVSPLTDRSWGKRWLGSCAVWTLYKIWVPGHNCCLSPPGLGRRIRRSNNYSTLAVANRQRLLVAVISPWAGKLLTAKRTFRFRGAAISATLNAEMPGYLKDSRGNEDVENAVCGSTVNDRCERYGRRTDPNDNHQWHRNR